MKITDASLINFGKSLENLQTLKKIYLNFHEYFKKSIFE